MRITAALKQFFLAKGWITAEATDDQIKQAVTAKLIGGEIDAAKLAELQAEAPAQKTLAQMIADAISPLAAQVAALTERANNPAPPPPNPAPPPPPASPPPPPASPPPPPPATPPPANPPPTGSMEEIIARQVKQSLTTAGLLPSDNPSVTPTQLFSRAAQAGWLNGSPRVKSPLERYSTARTSAVWGEKCKHVDLRGKRVTTPSLKGPGMGRPLDLPSTADEAVIGAYFKWAVGCNNPNEELPRGLRMNDHDWDLIKHAIHEMPWHGCIGGEWGEAVDGLKLTEMQRKTLLDDSVSGGIWAVPLVLDDSIIMTPLLYGELFPLVEVVNLTQGRRVEAFTFGVPTFTSGIPEGTSIPLFDTTNFIGALDTVIQNAVGAMEIGNDFEEDSPANIGSMVIARYGEAALQWLDRVIPLGDGVTEPKGIFNTSGTVAVNSANNTTGPLVVGDLEGLMFAVNKAYRTSKGGRNVFIGNEVSYRRFRSIPTGAGTALTYNTRVFGMEYGDYTALGFPYKIQPQIPNGSVAFVNMAWYRMYRRLGTQVKVERGGKELSLKNVTLIVVRMRYGGQLTGGGAAGVMEDGQS